MSRTDACSVDGCKNQVGAGARGMCSTHYQRWKRFGDPGEPGPKIWPRSGECSVEGCVAKQYSKGYCVNCYARYRRNGTTDRLVAQKGEGHLNEDGYRIVYKDGRHIAAHRWMMEQFLERPLLPEEEVHHKNGIRDDNRMANFELWSGSHPRGQRVEDKVEWAKEILSLYEHYLIKSDV